MTRINPVLLERVANKRQIKQRQVYQLIENVVRETAFERPEAALVLAMRSGININPLSSAAQRAVIRTGLSTGATASAGEPVSATPSQGRLGNAKRAKTSVQPKDNSVFVVHGRNVALRKSMFAFLRALGLKPKEWEKATLEAKGNNPHVDTIVETAMARAQAVVVILSPDDDVKLKDEFLTSSERRTEGRLQGQPRPNVIFEAGLALGRHTKKTLLVQVGTIKPMSDIFGKHITRLNNSYARRNDVAGRLEKIGCRVDRQGSDWTSEGNFDL